MRELIIKAEKITKVYPDGTVALRDVDFEVKEREIHGLLGENGAGKTTLTKIIYGILQPTNGRLMVNGKEVSFRRPHDALKEGIGMVQQHFALVDSFTVLENILLGTGVNPRGKEAKKVVEKVLDICNRTGLSIPINEKVENLSVGERQRVEILKLLNRNVRLLILDEPTSSLTPGETDELFKVLLSLKEEGKSIVFITHKLREVMQICDRITVLRKGVVTGNLNKNDATPQLLARLMVGKEVELIVNKEPLQPGNEVLRVEDLTVLDSNGKEKVRNVFLTVREYEIYGIAGVEGNGQTELAEAISGMRHVFKGRIILSGKDITNLTPKKIRRAGAALIPEDRTKTGLILDMDLNENVLLGKQREPAFRTRFLTLSWKRISEFADKLVRAFEIVVPRGLSKVKSMSGGNQQKVVVSRELSTEPVFILASQPTRGLDVASTEYMRNLLLKMRSKGKAILLISADLDEVLQLSDRVAVMYEGRIIGEFDPKLTPREKVGMMMGGIRS